MMAGGMARGWRGSSMQCCHVRGQKTKEGRPAAKLLGWAFGDFGRLLEDFRWTLVVCQLLVV
jgi:hypothetical protein